jgi:hypothetical protein
MSINIMQKEKIDRSFYKNWITIAYPTIRAQKLTKKYNKVIARFLSSLKVTSSNFSLRKIITYTFSGFSIIFIGYILMGILTHYPPRLIGISP